MHETLKQRSQLLAVPQDVRGFGSQQRRKQTGIQKLELRRPDQPLQAAAVPGTNAADQEHVLQQHQPAIHGLAVDAEARAKAGHVEQLACRDGRMVDQAGHFVPFPDRRDIRDIAFGKRLRIGAQPGTPTGRGGAGERRRISAGNDPFDQTGRRPCLLDCRKVAGKGPVE